MRQRISSLPVLPISVAPPLDPVRIAKEYDWGVLIALTLFTLFLLREHLRQPM
jgi:hypothetical protein